MKVQPPFPWLGGKGRLAGDILSRLPGPARDRTYIEPFFGGGAIFFTRKMSGIEVINDRNGEIIHFFRILRDNADELIRYLQNTPYSRKVFYAWRAIKNPEDLPEIERAARFFYVARSSFAAESTRQTPAWAFAKIADNKARSMATVIDRELLLIRDRLRYALIENDDAARVIRRFDSEAAIIYCDPPYVQETRREGGYADEMSDRNHEDLLAVLTECAGYVALSGYPNDLYREYLEEGNGWSYVDFEHSCLANRTSGIAGDIDRKRTERLWMNPRLSEWNAVHSPRQSLLFDLVMDGVA